MVQIIDRRTVSIPGPRGDVTPEAIEARDQALAASSAAGTASVEAVAARDEAVTLVDGIETAADGWVSGALSESDSSSTRAASALVSDAATQPRTVSAVSGVAAPNWTVDVTFTRLGDKVFVNGWAERATATSGVVNDIGYVLGPHLPAPIYGGAGTPQGDGTVRIPATGISTEGTGTGSAFPITLVMKPSGYWGIVSDLSVKKIVVSGSYLAKDAVILNPLDRPEFDGTYFKQWMTDHGMVEGRDFIAYHRRGTDPRLAVLGIHGGSGEAGSQEVAMGIAQAARSSLYYLDSRDGTYADMHMSSNGMDDPRAVPLVTGATRCLSMHGAADLPEWGTGKRAFVGGSDEPFRLAVIAALESAGFPCVDAAVNIPSLAGTRPDNICNLGPNQGVQIEMSDTLRRAMFAGDSYARTNRQNTTADYDAFVGALVAVAADWV